MRRFYSKVSSIALLLCLTTQTVFSMEEGRPAPRVAVAAPSLASPSCLKLSNIEAMRAWISKTEEFIQKCKIRSSAISKLQEDLTLPLVITLGPVIVPFMNRDIFETWEDQISGILNPKDLPKFPMGQDQFLGNIRADAAYRGPVVPLVVGTVYNFLFYFCEFRHDLCLKIAELSSDDADKLKYHQEAQRSLSYYFCHNFMPHIAPDKSLQLKLRENFIALSQKFAQNSERLQHVSLRTDSKIKYIKEDILNLNRQIELLDSTTHLSDSSQDRTEKSDYKNNIRRKLVLQYAGLFCFTEDSNYLDFSRKILDLLPSDSPGLDFLQEIMKRVSEEPQRQQDPALLLHKGYFSENSRLHINVLSGWYKIKKSLKNENFSPAVSHIKSLERLIHESFDVQPAQEGKDVARELSEVSLKKVYREYYDQMQRNEFLYPTIIDYILSFMIVGDIQGALDRFNAAGDLKFGDGETIRTHQPYLKAILENLRGNPEELLETSRRAVGELSSLSKAEHAEPTPEPKDLEVIPEKRKVSVPSNFPFLIQPSESFPDSFQQEKKHSPMSEEAKTDLMTQLENKRSATFPSRLIQNLKLLVKKLEEKSDVVSQREAESIKPVLSLTVTSENPPAPLSKVSAAQSQKSAAQEREEKRLRHLEKKKKREQKLRAAAAGPAEVDADVPAPVKRKKKEYSSPFEIEKIRT